MVYNRFMEIRFDPARGERWEGIQSLPRVRELEEAGLTRQAVAKLFGVTAATIRNAEKKAEPKEEA